MRATNDIIDEDEIASMAAEWGSPKRHHVSLSVGPEFWLPWEGKWHTRRGEVMFLLPRPGGLLLHRKHHYPPDCWRLLTGGIELGESVRESLAREPVEEVGLELSVRRYVALITYEVHSEGSVSEWATHMFLMAYSDAPLHPSHDDEIAETLELPLNALAGVTDRLERLPVPWADWGRFRAVAHRVVLADVREAELHPEA